jgi:hypothetical protein
LYFDRVNMELMEGMRLFVTGKGYIGIAYSKTRPGDGFYVLLGRRMLFVMRRCKGGYNVVWGASLHETEYCEGLEGRNFFIC